MSRAAPLDQTNPFSESSCICYPGIAFTQWICLALGRRDPPWTRDSCEFRLIPEWSVYPREGGGGGGHLEPSELQPALQMLQAGRLSSIADLK